MGEFSRITFDPCSQKAVMIGGGNAMQYSYQSCFLDTNLFSFNPINFLSHINKGFVCDMSCLAIDNNGYCYMASNTGNSGVTNQLYRFNLNDLTTPTHSCSTGFNLLEYSSTYFHQPEQYFGNGLNGLVTSNGHLYSYDGYNLRKYNSADLTLKNSKNLAQGDISKIYWSGIAANNCDGLLLANKDKIIQLDSNLNTIKTYTMSSNVYDIVFNDSKVYVSGKQFVSVFNVTDMGCLNTSISVHVPDSCRGTGSATVTTTGGVVPYTIVTSP